MTWRKTDLAPADLGEGALREAMVGEEPVLLTRHGGELLAFPGRCPHEGGVLAEGRVDAGRLVCPLHGATFELPQGRIVADPDGITPPSGTVASLTRYRTRVLDGKIEVDLA